MYIYIEIYIYIYIEREREKRNIYVHISLHHNVRQQYGSPKSKSECANKSKSKLSPLLRATGPL